MTTPASSTIATEIVLPGKVEPDGLRITTRSLPPPAAGQALVHVEASGVSFAEQQMRRGRYPGQPTFPFVPGYDLVGTVTNVGTGVSEEMIDRRYAALTKTGGWASDVLLDAADLMPVPDGIDPAAAETLVVNGLTAWQMLLRTAKVRRGQTVVVFGANGGVGTTLLQLAHHAGIRVIGLASARHHDAIRALGAVPVDYHDPDVPAQVRHLAPAGVDAVFDNVGGPGLRDSWRMLAPGGTLVSYAAASAVGGSGSVWSVLLRQMGRLMLWNALPNGRHAAFYDVWGGSRRNRAAFRARQAEDLGQVFTLLKDGAITAQIAARVPLTDAAEAMRLAESRTKPGKVVLIP